MTGFQRAAVWETAPNIVTETSGQSKQLRRTERKFEPLSRWEVAKQFESFSAERENDGEFPFDRTAREYENMTEGSGNGRVPSNVW